MSENPHPTPESLKQMISDVKSHSELQKKPREEQEKIYELLEHVHRQTEKASPQELKILQEKVAVIHRDLHQKGTAGATGADAVRESPVVKERPWTKAEGDLWDRLRVTLFSSSTLRAPPKSDTQAGKVLQNRHRVLATKISVAQQDVEKFQTASGSADRAPGKARALLEGLRTLEDDCRLYDAQYKTTEIMTLMQSSGLKLDFGVWERVAVILATGHPQFPDTLSLDKLDNDGKKTFERAKTVHGKLSSLHAILRLMDEGADGDLKKLVENPNFPAQFSEDVQAYPAQLEEYKSLLGSLGTYALESTLLETMPQLKNVRSVVPLLENLLAQELPEPAKTPGWEDRKPEERAQIESAYTNLSQERGDILAIMNQWKIKLLQCSPAEAKAAMLEIQRVYAWSAMHIRRRQDYAERVHTKVQQPDNVRDFLKMIGMEASEEFAESLWKFDGKASRKITRPLVSMASAVDLGMERTILAAQEMCARSLSTLGLKKIPKVDSMLRQMAKTKLGADLIRSTVMMESPVTVLLWGLHMQSSDNKLLAAYQWAGFLATSHVCDKLMTAASASLEAMGFGKLIAKIPGNPVVKFTATLLIMFGFNKEFSQLMTTLEDVSRYRILGPDTTARAENVLVTISGDALLSRIVAGMEETGLELFGTGAVDPTRDRKTFLQRQQLQGGEYVVDLGRKFTRSFEDWNAAVEQKAERETNPYLKKLFLMEKIDDPQVFARREALELRGSTRMARGWEKQIQQIAAEKNLPQAAELDLVRVAVGDDGERNDLAVQKRLFELTKLKYAIEDSKDPAMKELQVLWRQYLTTVEKMSTDVRMYRHLSSPETPMGPNYHMRIAYSSRDWVGDMDSDSVPKMVEQGLAEELAFQLRRREALEVQSSMDAHLLTQAGRKLQLDNQATFGRITDQHIQNAKDFLDDFRRNLTIRKLFEDKGDIAQLIHQEFGSLSSALQAAAHQLQGPARERVFTQMRERLVLPKGELDKGELLNRLKAMRMLVHEELMNAQGVSLKIVDSAAKREFFGVFPGTTLLCNAKVLDHPDAEWIAKKFKADHKRENDVAILRVNASERGGWTGELTTIRTFGIVDSAHWEVTVRRGNDYHFGQTGKGITFSDEIKMPYEDWRTRYPTFAKAVQPHLDEVRQKSGEKKNANKRIDEDFGRQQSDLQKEYIAKHEKDWLEKKGDMRMNRVVRIPDRQNPGKFLEYSEFAGTASVLLYQNKEKMDAIQDALKKGDVNIGRTRSDWSTFSEALTSQHYHVETREHKEAMQNAKYIVYEMVEALRMLKYYQKNYESKDAKEKPEKPGPRPFDDQMPVEFLSRLFDYHERTKGVRFQHRDLIIFALSPNNTSEGSTQMRDALQKKYPAFMIRTAPYLWRVRRTIVDYPEVSELDRLQKERDHIEKESGRGSREGLNLEASEWAKKLTEWKRKVYEATQNESKFTYIPAYPYDPRKQSAPWGVFVKGYTDPQTGKKRVLFTTTFEIPEKGFRYHYVENDKDVWDFDVRKFGFENGATQNQDVWWKHLGVPSGGGGHFDIAKDRTYNAIENPGDRKMTRDVLTSSLDVDNKGTNTSILRILLLFMPGERGDDKEYREKLYNTLGALTSYIVEPKAFLNKLLSYLESNHPIDSDSKLRALGRELYHATEREWGLDSKLPPGTVSAAFKKHADVTLGRSI